MSVRINWDALKNEAKEAMSRAYAPYSQFLVGAAVISQDGSIYSGGNIENASYGGSVCAERVAIWKAISEGQTHICALLIATSHVNYVPPCGFCRQILSEFAEDCPIAMLNGSGEIKEISLSQLLPQAFNKSFFL